MGCSLERAYQSGHTENDIELRPGGDELSVKTILRAGFAQNERILDLGCGKGAGTRLLRQLGCAPVGLDPISDCLLHAKSSIPDLALIVGAAHQLPLVNDSFDGILAECSLSLAGYRAEVLSECHRVLRPGAKLAITDMYARLTHPAPITYPSCLSGITTAPSIRAALEDAGFSIEHWEDQSCVLKNVLAQLIFEAPKSNSEGENSTLLAALKNCRPGYFMLIATKTARS
ncbi:DVU_1556 family methyltransferase [Uliginosibacterium gangwonense]|uniref:DVU_1556 family methyltransferase n=1 Tax=Uliginosibacterium gangwonense TaxID=392736 RepID=UPI0009FD630D|nr:class I SAM-dependent methyltransferase [Uliginosibacterium gangwonense]